MSGISLRVLAIQAVALLLAAQASGDASGDLTDVTLLRGTNNGVNAIPVASTLNSTKQIVGNGLRTTNNTVYFGSGGQTPMQLIAAGSGFVQLPDPPTTPSGFGVGTVAYREDEVCRTVRLGGLTGTTPLLTGVYVFGRAENLTGVRCTVDAGTLSVDVALGAANVIAGLACDGVRRPPDASLTATDGAELHAGVVAYAGAATRASIQVCTSPVSQ